MQMYGHFRRGGGSLWGSRENGRAMTWFGLPTDFQWKVLVMPLMVSAECGGPLSLQYLEAIFLMFGIFSPYGNSLVVIPQKLHTFVSPRCQTIHIT